MKRILILALAIFLLAACSTKEPKEPEVVEDENNIEQNELEKEPENVEEEPSESEEEPEKDESTNEGETNEDTTNKNEETESSDKGITNVNDLVDLTFAILKAQNEADYAFLESVLSKGSKLNKSTNTFTFNNVTYPHEQEFLTDNTAADLEHRYVHDEDKKSVIVGFAAADYENEYNYVIDFEFVLEDGSYKMNDMDINK